MAPERGNDSTVDAGRGERRGAGRYFQALREHWPFVIGTVALAVTAALAYAVLADKRYEAQADILVTPVSGDDETFAGISVLRETVEARSVLTVARLVTAPQVADSVKRRLGLIVDRNELLDDIEVRPQEQSNILTVTATARTPADAAALANAFAQVLIERRTAAFQQSLQAVLGRLASRLRELPATTTPSAEAAALSGRVSELRGLVGLRDPTLEIANRAVPPQEAAWPRPVLSVVVGALAGVLLGMGIAVGLEILNPLVLREEDLALEYGVPVLARLPRIKAKQLREYIRSGSLPADVMDGFRMLWANLVGPRLSESLPQTVLVTSAGGREEKTLTAVGLSASLALGGTRVALVDADVRSPGVAPALGELARGRDGLAGVVLGDTSVEDALLDLPRYGGSLRMLVPGAGDAEMVDLLQAANVDRLLAELKLYVDVVVLDAPPAAEAAEGLSLASASDAVLVVVRLGRTRRDDLSRLMRLLGQHGLVPAGFVAVTSKRVRGSGGARSSHVSRRGERAVARADIGT
jgi:Mrp family chromosome partitioning ATPase